MSIKTVYSYSRTNNNDCYEFVPFGVKMLINKCPHCNKEQINMSPIRDEENGIVSYWDQTLKYCNYCGKDTEKNIKKGE